MTVLSSHAESSILNAEKEPYVRGCYISVKNTHKNTGKKGLEGQMCPRVLAVRVSVWWIF